MMMLVASYVKGDVLAIMLKDSKAVDQEVERKGDIARIFNKTSGETVGYNLFNASQVIELNDLGPIQLPEEAVLKLNIVISQASFEPTLEVDSDAKFVVGYVKELHPHEDSDHLSITQTEVNNGELLQIVCGAPNVDQGQKVVVAKPGAIMPNGLVIWPNELRGVKSNGMICSAKELGIRSNQKKGILVLDDDRQVGEVFDV